MKKLYFMFLSLMALQSQAQIITTIAGTGASAFTGDGIAATASGVHRPYDVGMDSIGNIYIGDVGNNRIRQVDTFGVIRTVAGTGVAGYNGDGIVATTAQLNFPYGMAVNRSGTIVITDMNNNRIRSIQSVTGGIIITIGGTGVAGYSGDGGPAVLAQIHDPQGIFWDRHNNVFFSDATNNRVRKIDGGGIITTVAGNGTTGSGGDGGPATAASVEHPSGVTADTAGNIYIAEMYGHRIRKISTTGIITTIAGTGTIGYGGDGGPATLANIRYPKGVCVDRFGNVIIADTDNQRIRKIDVTTGIITTIGGTGVVGFSGDGGPATLAKLNYHQGVYVDSSGNLYTGDCLNNRVRKIACVPPVPGTVAGADTVCVGDTIILTPSVTGGTWSSSSPGATVTGGVVTGVSVGPTNVAYVISNTCTSVVVSHPVYVKSCSTTGMNGGMAGRRPGIYPNPATHEVTISGVERMSSISISNVSGQTVYSRSCNTMQVSVDVAQFANGVYFVKVNGRNVGKFVKM